MRRFLPLLIVLLASCASHHREEAQVTAHAADVGFNEMADEYLQGHLAFSPGAAVALGLHEFDGRITDYSRASLDTELKRLQKFQARLAALKGTALSPRAHYDFRILQSAVHKQLFAFQEMGQYTRNPITYAGALDVNIYIKRDFAPLESRARSIIAILNQASNVLTAARANLEETLPRPVRRDRD